MSSAAARPPAAFIEPRGSGALAFRNLRTAAGVPSIRRGSVALLFTGVHAGEGTSTIASNYALLASAAGQTTLLIDANLSRPVLHELLGGERRPGVADVAAGVVSVEDAVQTVSVGAVDMSFLPAGAPMNGAIDVLGSPLATEMIDDACRIYDTVVIDSSPVLAMADAAVLSAHREIDTIVVVSRGQRRARVTRTLSQLRRSGANVIGLAVNSG